MIDEVVNCRISRGRPLRTLLSIEDDITVLLIIIPGPGLKMERCSLWAADVIIGSGVATWIAHSSTPLRGRW